MAHDLKMHTISINNNIFSSIWINSIILSIMFSPKCVNVADNEFVFQTLLVWESLQPFYILGASHFQLAQVHSMCHQRQLEQVTTAKTNGLIAR